MDTQKWIEQHFAMVFPIYFVLLWLAVSAIISYIGGWRTLSKSFRAREPFVDKKRHFQSGQFRWLAGYHNCLTLGADPNGLYLGILFLFRFMHPPLFIPWSEVSVQTKRSWILGERVTFTLGREVAIPLTIRGRLIGRLKVAAGNGWPLESIQA